MTANNGSPASDKQTADAAVQAKLTQSVGEPLTRESYDAAMPLWKRWLKKADAGSH